jgi:hypothetical protein
MASENRLDAEERPQINYMELSNPSPILSTRCNQATCRPGCALEVVDRLLTSLGPLRGEEMDTLLELRFSLHRLENPEEILTLFCKLRRSLEQYYYLEFFRLRRWLENHVQAHVISFRGGPVQTIPLRLDFFCLEAVRGHCLAQARSQNLFLTAARIRFKFEQPELVS